MWTLKLRNVGLTEFARVAQLTERWSYKPEVEGLNPSLGTSNHFPYLIFQFSFFIVCIRVSDVPDAQLSWSSFSSRARLEE